MKKQDIKNLTPDELKKEIVALGEKPYRASQILTWIYGKRVFSFDRMKNIPGSLKDKLKERYLLGGLTLLDSPESKDGTLKFLFELEDGRRIESVLIPSGGRSTLCLSAQVGCKFACNFCASGIRGFVRNLETCEILNQIVFVENNVNNKATNYVFMGMGEPLDNYENVIKAIRIMNSPECMNIGSRRITLSTCGIVTGIERLKDENLKINLSLSIHAANDPLRSSLMPVNKKYPLPELLIACGNFLSGGGRMLTLEYVIIGGINDSLKDADEFSKIARSLKAKVNLIPYSPVSSLKYKAPSGESVRAFMDELNRKRVTATLRASKGKDINAGCGQLVLRNAEKMI
ncbi:MAG: 23S rRNA (adenine(2503)-C(2))-methyltransferase RlmN [Candidatus Omnitrophica bacterium]|nr:23S rRNA (adenine(2503)-C(2))-methyltransferase RlmN [Candidatus Omnitrophota bacterium]